MTVRNNNFWGLERRVGSYEHWLLLQRTQFGSQHA